MCDANERIERLISRRLDGALSAAEEVELDRLLLQSPEDRRLFEETEHLDALAGHALGAEFGTARPVRLAAASPVPVDRVYSRAWWALPLAAAAAIALIFVIVPKDPQSPQFARQPARPALSEERTPPAAERIDSGVYQASHGFVDRALDQDSIYVVGSDGRIYVIDRQWLRTMQQPGSAGRVRQASGEL